MVDIGLLIVGHLIGDYIVQNDWMALNKKKPGLAGTIPCLIHCFWYSMAVSLIGAMNSNATVRCYLFLIAFVTHYPIDRTNVVERWMELFGQTTFKTVELIEDEKLRAARKQFVPLVYVGVDNSVHLLLMVLAVKLIIG